MYRINRKQAYLVIALAFLLQISLSNFLHFSHIKPNLMLIVTVFFALSTNERFGAETGFFSGLLLDIFSIRSFGLNAVLFAAGGYLIGKSNNKFYRDSVITHVILTFTASFFVLSGYFAFINARTPSVPNGITLKSLLDSSILSVSLLNAFLGIWIYAFLIRVLGISEIEL